MKSVLVTCFSARKRTGICKGGCVTDREVSLTFGQITGGACCMHGEATKESKFHNCVIRT